MSRFDPVRQNRIAAMNPVKQNIILLNGIDKF